MKNYGLIIIYAVLNYSQVQAVGNSADSCIKIYSKSILRKTIVDLSVGIAIKELESSDPNTYGDQSVMKVGTDRKSIAWMIRQIGGWGQADYSVDFRGLSRDSQKALSGAEFITSIGRFEKNPSDFSQIIDTNTDLTKLFTTESISVLKSALKRNPQQVLVSLSSSNPRINAGVVMAKTKRGTLAVIEVESKLVPLSTLESVNTNGQQMFLVSSIEATRMIEFQKIIKGSEKIISSNTFAFIEGVTTSGVKVATVFDAHAAKDAEELGLSGQLIVWNLDMRQKNSMGYTGVPVLAVVNSQQEAGVGNLQLMTLRDLQENRIDTKDNAGRTGYQAHIYMSLFDSTGRDNPTLVAGWYNKGRVIENHTMEVSYGDSQRPGRTVRSSETLNLGNGTSTYVLGTRTSTTQTNVTLNDSANQIQNGSIDQFDNSRLSVWVSSKHDLQSPPILGNPQADVPWHMKSKDYIERWKKDKIPQFENVGPNGIRELRRK